MMKPFILSVLVSSMVCTAAIAVADDMPATGMSHDTMAMPTPGPEIKSLYNFFGATTIGWTGTCPAGAMGPDSKQMETHCKGTAHYVADGFGVAWDIENVMGSGKDAMTWKGHMVSAWDPNTKQYRSSMVDNMGGLTEWTGTLEANKLTWETPEPFMAMGEMHKERISWTKNADGTIAFLDEVQPQGADWKTMETATFKAPKGGKSKTDHAMATDSMNK